MLVTTYFPTQTKKKKKTIHPAEGAPAPTAAPRSHVRCIINPSPSLSLSLSLRPSLFLYIMHMHMHVHTIHTYLPRNPIHLILSKHPSAPILPSCIPIMYMYIQYMRAPHFTLHIPPSLTLKLPFSIQRNEFPFRLFFPLYVEEGEKKGEKKKGGHSKETMQAQPN